MFLPRLLSLALATSALIASAQTTITGTYNTGAGKTAGSADANWDVYRFTNSSGLNVVTGSAGLATYLASTPVAVATARNASPFSSAWVTPTAASNSLWLSLAANASGQAIHDPLNGGGYAFVLDLGQILQPVATFAQPVSLSFSLRGDNGFSAHLLNNASGTGYAQLASILGSTDSNFGAANAPTVSYTGIVDSSTELVILLSNDTQTAGNPGGILVQNFSLAYSAIPEPATYAAIFGVALLGIALWSRRRRS